MSRERFTAWVTKYALTDGILKMLVEDCSEPTMVRKVNGQQSRIIFFHGNDWHRTPEAAVARAKEMQAKKLASIEKQRKRIAAIDFNKVLDQ